mmetsp:Transcript_89224/g.266141  ORF Transcript_89224/g.266141 Transcript_89224/m.266141 type:complete len:306 (-) Transcript_89224:528-1445(-)
MGQDDALGQARRPAREEDHGGVVLLQPLHCKSVGGAAALREECLVHGQTRQRGADGVPGVGGGGPYEHSHSVGGLCDVAHALQGPVDVRRDHVAASLQHPEEGRGNGLPPPHVQNHCCARAGAGGCTRGLRPEDCLPHRGGPSVELAVRQAEPVTGHRKAVAAGVAACGQEPGHGQETAGGRVLHAIKAQRGPAPGLHSLCGRSGEDGQLQDVHGSLASHGIEEDLEGLGLLGTGSNDQDVLTGAVRPCAPLARLGDLGAPMENDLGGLLSLAIAGGRGLAERAVHRPHELREGEHGGLEVDGHV